MTNQIIPPRDNVHTFTIIIGPLFPPNSLQYGYTPLHNAAWRGSREITSLLLAKEGQVDVENEVCLRVILALGHSVMIEADKW